MRILILTEKFLDKKNITYDKVLKRLGKYVEVVSSMNKQEIKYLDHIIRKKSVAR